MSTPTGVHLVGSLPVSSSSEAFNQVCNAIPNHILRLPDGEPGVRFNFIGWQMALIPDALRKGDTNDTDTDWTDDQVRDNLSSFKTGFDDQALASYDIFRDLKSQGVIPKHVRFLVALPTPTNVVAGVKRTNQPVFEKLYTAALLDSLRRIQQAIPHDQLAIQWDCAHDIAILERGSFYGRIGFNDPWWDGDEFEGVVERIVNVAKGKVDDDVEMGIHLCYGDLGHKHFVEPKDTANVARVIEAVWKGVGRKVDWVHLPVPKDREDEQYLEALVGVGDVLKKNGTTLYLGLVHANDEEGTKKRVQTAGKMLGKVDGLQWGVSTECGMGRTPKEEFGSILDISKKVSSPVV